MRGLDSRLRYQRVYQNQMKLKVNNESKLSQSKRDSANKFNPQKGDSQEMDKQPEAAAAGAADVDYMQTNRPADDVPNASQQKTNENKEQAAE